MKKIVFLILAFSFIASACQKIELKKEIPSSPKESYEPLPR